MKLYYTPGVCSMAVHIALREAGLPVTLADYPALQQYLSRVAARPAVQEAMRAEGLVRD